MVAHAFVKPLIDGVEKSNTRNFTGCALGMCTPLVTSGLAQSCSLTLNKNLTLLMFTANFVASMWLEHPAIRMLRIKEAVFSPFIPMNQDVDRCANQVFQYSVVDSQLLRCRNRDATTLLPVSSVCFRYWTQTF